ncbi:hypothetical protein [Pedobacter sp. Hv1]|uniref:hypothetical protein n=1 Tax=Pedobacter sp. Hv1 TaxID=1740090 RepID=UPI00128F7FC8|nr:hypothetical protein [Pedobacter sp. Hv1]
MKKNKQKALVKESKKVAKQEIKNNIVEDLKKLVGRFGQTSKKMDKVIEKEATQLAKKLSKEFKVVATAITDKKIEEIKPTAVKAVKPIEKAPAKKTAKKPTTSKENTPV